MFVISINLPQMTTQQVIISLVILGGFVTIWIWMVLKAQKEKIDLIRYI